MNYKPLATRELEEAVIGVWHYTYYEDEIEAIKIACESAIRHRSKTVLKPDIVSSENGIMLWSILVYAYGDYGTSPRSGWIDSPYFQNIIDMMEGIKCDIQ